MTAVDQHPRFLPPTVNFREIRSIGGKASAAGNYLVSVQTQEHLDEREVLVKGGAVPCQTPYPHTHRQTHLNCESPKVKSLAGDMEVLTEAKEER